MTGAQPEAKKKKNYKLLWQGISLVGMLAVPALVLYPAAELGNKALLAAGYVLLAGAMVIPLVLKK